MQDLNANEKCISLDLLYQYLERTVTKAEAKAIEIHLNSCETCFHEMASLIRHSHAPATDSEKRAIEKIKTMTTEEQVNEILSMVEIKPLVIPENDVIFFYKLWERIKYLFSIPPGVRWKLATGFACIILLAIFVGIPQYNLLRSKLLTQRAMSDFVTAYVIYSRDELRPVGGFEYNEFGGPIRRKNYQKTISELTLQKFEKAIRLNSKNLAVRHYLGTYYLLIKKNYDEARDHYMFVFLHDSTNTSILNDLAIVDLNQGYYDDAEQKFSLALQYDPNLLEAQYNLAELYERQQKIEQAIKEWEKYLTLDSTSIWAEIARDHLDRLLGK